MSQKFLRWFIRLFLPLFANVKMTGLENLPAEGGFVVASNHLGRLDTVVMLFAMDREDIILPTAEKYQNHWFFNPVVRGMGGIFIDRQNPDISILRDVIKRMRNGSLLAIAPEGTRSKTETLQEGKPGVVFFAAQAKVPIVPACMTGTEDRVFKENLLKFRKTDITVKVGPAYQMEMDKNLSREEALQKATDDLMCRIAALLPESYRGVYANHPGLAKHLIKE